MHTHAHTHPPITPKSHTHPPIHHTLTHTPITPKSHTHAHTHPPITPKSHTHAHTHPPITLKSHMHARTHPPITPKSHTHARMHNIWCTMHHTVISISCIKHKFKIHLLIQMHHKYKNTTARGCLHIHACTPTCIMHVTSTLPCCSQITDSYAKTDTPGRLGV